MQDIPAAKPEYCEHGDYLSKALKPIQEMLRTAARGQPLFPPTLLYNEGWLLPTCDKTNVSKLLELRTADCDNQ